MKIELRIIELEKNVDQLKKQVHTLEEQLKTNNIGYNKAGRKSKFTTEQKRSIYIEYKKNKISYNELAYKYKCSKATIHNIIKEEQSKSLISNMVFPIVKKNHNI